MTIDELEDTRDTFFCNTYYVIESLPGDEITTGVQIHKIIHKECLEAKWPVTSRLIQVHNKQEFIKALSFISESISRNFYPYIHIECHGNKNGLSLASNELFPWGDLINELRNINVRSDNNLLISLSVCFGIHITRAVALDKPSPFQFVIAPTIEESSGILYESYQEYFKTLIHSQEHNHAIRILEYFTPDKFSYWPAHLLFEKKLQLDKDSGEYKRVEKKAFRMFRATGKYSNNKCKKLAKKEIESYVKECRDIFLHRANIQNVRSIGL